MNDGEEETEVNTAKHDWGQLKEGVSHEEYVSCDIDIIMCEVQTLEWIMREKFYLYKRMHLFLSYTKIT